MNTKRVSKAGGVGIPIGLRREMNIQQGDAVDVEAGGTGEIILRLHQPRCLFCSTTENVTIYRGKGICHTCVAAAGKESEDGKQNGTGR